MKPVLRMGIIFGIILDFILGGMVLAESCNEGVSNISITIYLVNERDVCPDGYVENDSNEKSNCPPLSIGYINDKIVPKYKKHYSQSDIPPSTISLDEVQKIAAYNYNQTLKEHSSGTCDALLPDSRKAVIFVFKWREPHNLKIRLSRQQKLDKPFIDTKSWTGKGDGETHWIHHERGDAIWIANMVEWVLTLGEDPVSCWTFKLE